MLVIRQRLGIPIELLPGSSRADRLSSFQEGDLQESPIRDVSAHLKRGCHLCHLHYSEAYTGFCKLYLQDNFIMLEVS